MTQNAPAHPISSSPLGSIAYRPWGQHPQGPPSESEFARDGGGTGRHHAQNPLSSGARRSLRCPRDLCPCLAGAPVRERSRCHRGRRCPGSKAARSESGAEIANPETEGCGGAPPASNEHKGRTVVPPPSDTDAVYPDLDPFSQTMLKEVRLPRQQCRGRPSLVESSPSVPVRRLSTFGGDPPKLSRPSRYVTPPS